MSVVRNFPESVVRETLDRIEKRALKDGGEPPDNPTMTELSREEMQAELKAVRSDTKADGQTLRADFAELRGSMTTEFAAVRGEMRTEFAAVRGEMRTGFEALRSEIHKSSGDTIKWVVGTAIGLGAVTITVMAFVLNNAIPKVPPAQSQQPTIIMMPAAPAPAPAPVAPAPK